MKIESTHLESESFENHLNKSSLSSFDPFFEKTISFQHAREALLIWASLFFVCFVFCQGSVYVYAFLFLPSGQLSPSEAVFLLDSPPSIAFQVLMASLTYLFATFIVIQKHQLNIGKSLFSRKINPLALLCGTLSVLSSALLVDQILWYIDDKINFFPLENGLTHTLFNLNLADILAQIDQVNFISYSILVMVVIFLSPVFEEIFFRGLLLKAFTEKWGSVMASLISSFFYAISQFDLLKGINAFLLGIIYAYTVCTTGSVWAACLAHIVLSATTFWLSDEGFTYGIGGESYPISWVALALFFLLKSLILLRILRKAPQAES
ncbi:MAG: CPBP family intramembrane glutamic endopeptidase [Candidatus Caenarcaniphilales bacterium]|nr:CPBP family intramembrane glutamic endopeptidase [Candidatus Caenarcaniphilales bacterium]